MYKYFISPKYSIADFKTIFVNEHEVNIIQVNEVLGL